MKKKGAALLVVIIVMMLTFLLATIMFETSIKHLRVSNDTVDSTKAYYCAETGVYDAINYLELIIATGVFDSSYYGRNIPISNLYSNGENSDGSNSHLFGDEGAMYSASMELMDPILNDIENVQEDNKTVTVSTPLIEKEYSCKIISKGTYNNQNHLINDTVKIFYENGKWTYVFTSKLSTKD